MKHFDIIVRIKTNKSLLNIFLNSLFASIKKYKIIIPIVETIKIHIQCINNTFFFPQK